MNPTQIVQFAVLCLTELDAHQGKAVSCEEISLRQGIPLPECIHIIRRFQHAGIVDVVMPGRVLLRRPVEELTALEIVEAVWAKEDARTPFRMLLGGDRGLACRKTLEYVRRTSLAGING